MFPGFAQVSVSTASLGSKRLLSCGWMTMHTSLLCSLWFGRCGTDSTCVQTCIVVSVERRRMHAFVHPCQSGHWIQSVRAAPCIRGYQCVALPSTAHHGGSARSSTRSAQLSRQFARLHDCAKVPVHLFKTDKLGRIKQLACATFVSPEVYACGRTALSK